MPLQTAQGYNLGVDALGSVDRGLTLGNKIEDRKLLEQQRGVQLGRQQREQDFMDAGGLGQDNALDEAAKVGLDYQMKVAKGMGVLDERTGRIDKKRMDNAARFAVSAGGMNYDQQSQYIKRRAQELQADGRDPTQTLELLNDTPEERKAAFRTLGLANLPIDQIGKVLIGQSGLAKPTAAMEKDRQFKQLQSMPDSTPEEKKARDNYAKLIGAKGKQADIAEKVDTQQSVGDIKVKQDIKKAQEIANIKEEQDISTARKKSQIQKLSGYIESGVESADNLISAKRSLELLDSVATGGYDAAALKAKQLMGIESGDEAELSYELGKSVLKQLKPTFGAAFTVNEMLELKRMEAGLGKSVAGNKRILSKLVKLLGRSANRGMRAAKDQGDTFNYGEIERAMGVASGSKAKGSKDELTDEDLLKKYGG